MSRASSSPGAGCSGWRRYTITTSSRAGPSRRSSSASGSCRSPSPFWRSRPSSSDEARMSSLEEGETVTRGQAYLNSLAGRRVTVVGLAKSGVAAARLLRTAGAGVTGLDAERGGAAGCLADLGVRLLGGSADAASAFASTDLVVVSPGVPLDGAQLALACAARTPITGGLHRGLRAAGAGHT